MSLVTRLYNVKSNIHLGHLQQEFQYLQVDPYIKNGFRRKHITRFRKEKKQFIHLPNTPLYQSSKYNPVNGDVERKYPEFIPQNPCVISDLLNLFADVAKVPNGQVILLQAQRITCSPYDPGYPSVEDWHRDNVTKIGVLCVDRQNIEGGTNQFRLQNPHDSSDIVSLMLHPGYMVVFDDDIVEHRVTPITSADRQQNGYRDVVLFSYPDYIN